MDRAELGRRIKYARQEANLKQEDLANKLGVPVSAISILESGNRKLDVFELLKVAEVCEKPVEWFYRSHDASQRRRWYDSSDIMGEAFEALRRAPRNMQIRVSQAVLAFLKDNG